MPATLQNWRKRNRLTQVAAASLLGVSQPYLSLLENEARPLTPALKCRMKAVCPPDNKQSYDVSFAANLSALGYPGFLKQPVVGVNVDGGVTHILHGRRHEVGGPEQAVVPRLHLLAIRGVRQLRLTIEPTQERGVICVQKKNSQHDILSRNLGIEGAPPSAAWYTSLTIPSLKLPQLLPLATKSPVILL